MQGLRLILLCSKGIQSRPYFSALPCGGGEESGVPLPTSRHKLKKKKKSHLSRIVEKVGGLAPSIARDGVC